MVKLETDFGIKIEQIYDKPEDFSSCLHLIFGRAGSVVQRAYLRMLYRSLDAHYEPKLDLKEELDYAKEVFERSQSRN